MNAIELHKLTKRYGKHRGIEDLTLAVPQGSFFGFIGPNGAGKSTTIRCLLGLIKPTAGEAVVLGKPLGDGAGAYLGSIGYMPSETMFYRGMTVAQTIRLSADLRHARCADEAARLCDALGLDTGKRVDDLSLGNRKKVSIVCALQHRPDLYILDEPTSGLDPLVQRTFFELLGERNAQGATVFFSSHVLSEVQQHCTQTAIIREGRLAAVGSLDELKGTRVKRVTVFGANSAPQGLPVRSVDTTGDSVSFLYSGEPAALLEELAKMRPADFTVTEPDLEELFMHYYDSAETKEAM